MVDLCLLTGFVLIVAFAQMLVSNSYKQYAGIAGEKSESTVIRYDKIIFVAGMAVLFALTALRGIDVGNDTRSYHEIFMQAVNEPDRLSESRYEIGYVLLNKFFALFTDNAQWLLAACAFVSYVCFTYYILRNSPNLALSFVLFFLFEFGGLMNTVRQGLAIGFVLIAYDRTVRKQIVRSVFWIIIAILFHSSAVIALAIPLLLPYIKFNKIWLVLGIVVAVVFAFSDLLYRVCLLIAPSYAHYFGGQYDGSGFLAITYQVLRNGMFFVLGYVIFTSKNRGTITQTQSYNELSAYKQINLQLWLLFLAFAGIVVGYKINLIDRVVGYISAFWICIIPNFLKKLPNDNRRLLTIGIVAILIIYSVVVQIIRPHWNTVFPYSFFWES